MFHVVLYQPEIPPNAGNIIRLCANCGAQLHLVRPLGFRIDDKSLVRAGLDYRMLAAVTVHDGWPPCRTALARSRLYMVSTRGETRYDLPRYRTGDAFVFGPETTGLPEAVLAAAPAQRRIRLPMVTSERSLNLANAAAIVLYEAWRQNGFREGV